LLIMFRMRNLWRLMQLLGLTCLVMVVLTHVAEAYRVFPAMGWGRPTSAGYYLDLGSRLIKSTIPGRLQDRRTPSSFGPTYRIVWRCA
jgi:hypothetical protein